MAVYAIGDVQGCFDELQQLLKHIEFNKDADTLWFCGDIVNRGPRSLDTLEYIHSIRDNCVVVLGNHDLHLLATHYHHKRTGRKDTLDEILEADNKSELLDWLRRRPLVHHDEELGISMVHAGLHPDWDIATAMGLASEVEEVLRGGAHTQFYRHMYGDKPHYWSQDLHSWPRLRYITNILTRIRYFYADRKAALNAKGAPDTYEDDHIPWFDFPQRASLDDRIILGHWSTLSLIDREFNNVYPLDDGCLWGGRLTAMRLDENPLTTHQIDCLQRQDPRSPR